MHIPKTAGSAFRNYLERWVRENGETSARRSSDGIWSELSESYPSYTDFFSEASREYRSAALVSGHYPYEARTVLPPETEVVTVFRKPVERVLSHVKHQMALERQTAAREVEDDVNGFLDNPRNEMFLHTIGNLQLKYLCRAGDPDDVVGDRELRVDTALEVALRCRFGFNDELREFCVRLARDLFSSPIPVLSSPFENRSGDGFSVSQLSPRNRALVRELTQLEQEFEPLLRRILRERRQARWESAPPLGASPGEEPFQTSGLSADD